MTIATRQDFIDQFNEINAVINSNHQFISNEPNPSKKRSAIRQINTMTGFDIEQIRVKLEKNESVTEEEVAQIRTALADYYAPRHRNNVFARFVLNFLPVLLTGPIFHLFYWLIDKFVVLGQSAKSSLSDSSSVEEEESENKAAKFRWDWTKAIPAIGRSFSTLKAVKSFLDDTEDFDMAILQDEDQSQKEDSHVDTSEDDGSKQSKDKSGKSETAEAKAARLKAEAEQAKKEKSAARKAKKAKSTKAKPIIFDPEIVNPMIVENAELKPLVEMPKKDPKVEFDPVIVDSKTVEAVVELKPLVEMPKKDPKVEFDPVIIDPKSLEVAELKPLEEIKAQSTDAGQLVHYQAAQLRPSIFQRASGFAKKFAAPFVTVLGYLKNPSTLVVDLSSMAKKLVKQPVASQPLALRHEETDKAVTKVEIVEHSYEGIINGNEAVTLNLFVIFEGQKRSEHAFIYNVHGDVLGCFNNADELRSAFPNIQFDIEVERNLITGVHAQAQAEEVKVVVLQDEEEDKSAIVVATAQPEDVVSTESGWTWFSNKVKTGVNSLTSKFSFPTLFQSSCTASRPDTNAMQQSERNPTGLPDAQLAMREDPDDVNWHNEARDNPSVALDLDALEAAEEADKKKANGGVSYQTIVEGLVVRSEDGTVVRAAGSESIAIDLSPNPFDGFEFPVVATASNPFSELAAPVRETGSNPFDGFEFPVGDTGTRSDDVFVDLSTNGEGAEDPSPDFF